MLLLRVCGCVHVCVYACVCLHYYFCIQLKIPTTSGFCLLSPQNETENKNKKKKNVFPTQTDVLYFHTAQQSVQCNVAQCNAVRCICIQTFGFSFIFLHALQNRFSGPLCIQYLSVHWTKKTFQLHCTFYYMTDYLHIHES